jgi:hypothetical protein
MKRIIWILGSLGLLAGVASADPLVWQVPYFGTVNLNLQTTEAVLGYDAVLKQAIGGVSLPVYTDPKGILTLQVGADAPWQNNNATVEPLILAGHDILKEIPSLSQYKTLHLNVFARYASEQGKAGVGVAALLTHSRNSHFAQRGNGYKA